MVEIWPLREYRFKITLVTAEISQVQQGINLCVQSKQSSWQPYIYNRVLSKKKINLYEKT